ncbi:TPA: DUF3100 domain-containing protein [Photobacterium damselae]
MSNKTSLKSILRTTTVVLIIIFISQYLIGKVIIPLPFLSQKIILLPMLFSVVIGIIVSLDNVRNKINIWGRFFTKKEATFSGKMLGIMLTILGTQYAGMIIPNIDKIIDAGLPLIFQELGNLLPVFIAIPIAVKWGLGRQAIGAGSSISREPSIAVIEQKYGSDGPEYIGVMGLYICGGVVGTIWFSLLGSLAPMTGINPLALAAGSGVGSGSMLSAASGALVSSLSPELASQVLSIGAASNLLSSVIGAFSLTYLGLPLAELMYSITTNKEKSIKHA